MNGRWALQYTTALEVLGKNRPGFLRPKGAIWQTVDIFTLQVKNEESFEPLPFVKFKNATTSDLDAQTESRAGGSSKGLARGGGQVRRAPGLAVENGAEHGDEGVGGGELGVDGHHVRRRGDAHLAIAIGGTSSSSCETIQTTSEDEDAGNLRVVRARS